MSKLISKFLLPLTILLLSHQALAVFSLNGTRFIYTEGQKNISLEVYNSSNETYGGQIWVANTIQNKDEVYFVPSPPLFTVNAKQKQIVRLLKVNSSLPDDRESIFWLNVQEIPPKPEEGSGNTLAIAMNTQVKLFYRPKAIQESRKNAEQKITLVNNDGKLALKNPTPYYFAIVRVNRNGSQIKLPVKVMNELQLMAPYSTVALGKINTNGKISIDAINDWGGEQQYEIH